jgi:phosphatidylserine/phosphatidylglycerophosphate/cardiolipin synthase-like enzyme
MVLRGPPPVIHYAPAENLEHVDVALIDRAEHEIDMAAYVLTDWPIKHETSAPMHLKSYQIDGRLLRTGAANFSASGLKRQDNDLIVIESAGDAAAFKREFDSQFASGEALPIGPGQDKNLKHY